MSPPWVPPEKMISCQRTKTFSLSSTMRGSQENTFGLRDTLTGAAAGVPWAENLWKSTSLRAWSTQATAIPPLSSIATVGSST
jgi:hypothetical protein